MSKILIVEDDPMLSEIYQMKLSSSGFEVFLAETGKQALEIIKKEKIDVVLSDLVMPEMDGFKLLKILRSGEYDPNIKIIMLSNLSQDDSRKEVLGLGANGFLAKSDFTPAEMVKEVKRMINA